MPGRTGQAIAARIGRAASSRERCFRACVPAPSARSSARPSALGRAAGTKGHGGWGGGTSAFFLGNKIHTSAVPTLPQTGNQTRVPPGVRRASGNTNILNGQLRPRECHPSLHVLPFIHSITQLIHAIASFIPHHSCEQSLQECGAPRTSPQRQCR